MIITKTSKDLKPYLLEPQAKTLKNPYYLIKDHEQIIYVITPGLNGVEFNKTEVFISGFEGISLVTCIYGHGLVLLQRNDEAGEAKEFKVVTLSSGRQIGVPAGWSFSLVNVGKGFLVILQTGSTKESILNGPLVEKGGLAYFVIEKKGEISFEQNPKYKVHPQITTE